MSSTADFAQFIADLDDHAYLSSLVRETCKALPLAPKRRPDIP